MASIRLLLVHGEIDKIHQNAKHVPQSPNELDPSNVPQPDSLLSRFWSNKRGNVAIIFGLSTIPLLLAAGAAIDYAGANHLSTRLKLATDGVALQLCQLPGKPPTQLDYKNAAQNGMLSYMGQTPFTVPTLTTVESPRQVRIVTQASYKTAIFSIAGAAFQYVGVTADSTCQAQEQTFEIALVLDNTGSMSKTDNSGVSKMDSVKQAATSFVNFVYGSPKLSNAKFSLVPFAMSVAIQPSTGKTAWWADANGKASYHWNVLQGGASAVAPYSAQIKSRFDVFNYLQQAAPSFSWDWKGCFESLPYPLNVRDGSPSSSNPDSYYVPLFSPDESGDGGSIQHTANGATVTSPNSYIDDANTSGSCPATTDEAMRTGRTCKYVQLQNPKTSNGQIATGPNAICTTRPLTPLTATPSTILNEISAMAANGNTNIHEGVMWGWRTLSPTSVLSGTAAPYNKPFNNKVIVLMTDGTNNWPVNPSNVLKSYGSAYGFLKNPDGTDASARLQPGASAQIATTPDARKAIDALTTEACQNARAAGIQIYTIGFSVPVDPIDSAGLSMLQSCATDANHAFVANDGTSLQAAFKKISDNIGSVRLAK